MSKKRNNRYHQRSKESKESNKEFREPMVVSIDMLS